VTSEPKCWGDDELPLLPKEIKRYLSKTQVAEKKTGKKHGSLPMLMELDLVNSNFWSGHEWTEAPTLCAVNVFSELILENGSDVLGFPLVQLESTSLFISLADFPLTLDTWDVLNCLEFEDAEFGTRFFEIPVQSLYVELCDKFTGTHLTLCRALLDLIITARSWLQDDQGESFDQPQVQLTAESIEDILKLAAFRTLRSCGYEPASLELSTYDWAIALRLGLHQSGKTTLEAAASIAGLTRERIRQITTNLADPSHENIRKWKLPELLKQISSEFSSIKTIDEASINPISRHFPDDWDLPFELLERIFHAFGHEPPYMFLDNGGMVLSTDIRNVAGEDFLREIHRICMDKCGDLGFFIKKEALNEIVQQSHGLSEQELATAIDSCLTLPNLPFGYGYLEKTNASKTTVNIASKMLSWAGRLDISEIVTGIEKVSRFRKISMPPPAEVLLEYFRHTTGFEVTNQLISLNHYTDRETETVEGKIALLIENSPALVVSKSYVQDYFRNNVGHSGSVTTYLTYSPLLKSVGKGCVTIVGANPSDEDILDAKQLANALSIDPEIEVFFNNDQCVIKMLVGTLLRDSGTFIGTQQLRRAMGLSKFQITDESGNTFGMLGCSKSAIIYSLSSFFNAKEIEPGDYLTLTIDFQGKTVTID
jgi:hypothetical protein